VAAARPAGWKLAGERTANWSRLCVWYWGSGGAHTRRTELSRHSPREDSSLYIPPSFSAVVPRPSPARRRPGFHREVEEARGAVLIREALSLRCPSLAASGDGAGFLLQAVGRVSGHRAVSAGNFGPGIAVWGCELGLSGLGRRVGRSRTVGFGWSWWNIYWIFFTLSSLCDLGSW
jgi:hypothetical protein